MHPSGKHRVKNACVSARACRERGSWMIHSFKNLWSSNYGSTSLVTSTMLGTWYALDIQYLHLKTKAQLLACAFVCKHEVIVWDSVLSDHFKVICNRKDGLRWGILSPENVSQFILSIIIYLENLSTSTLKSNRIIIRKTMAENKWRALMQGEGMLDKIGIIYWMTCQTPPSSE